MLKSPPWSLVFLVVLTFAYRTGQESIKITEDDLSILLAEYNSKSIEWCRRANLASWNVATDVGNKGKEEEKVRKYINFSKFNL